MSVRLPQFNLHVVFLVITTIATLTAIVFPIFSEPAEVTWRPLTVAGVSDSIKQGKESLILVEGHAGGMHQYFVVKAQVDNLEFRRFVHSSGLVVFRANRYEQPSVWDDFRAFAHFPDRDPPFLIVIRKGGEYECVQLDPNASTSEVVKIVRSKVSTQGK